MSNSCLEGIRIVSGFWKVSGRCLEGVWKVSGGSQEGVWKLLGRCLEGVWNKNPYLISTGSKDPICLCTSVVHFWTQIFLNQNFVG